MYYQGRPSFVLLGLFCIAWSSYGVDTMPASQEQAMASVMYDFVNNGVRETCAFYAQKTERSETMDLLSALNDRLNYTYLLTVGTPRHRIESKFFSHGQTTQILRAMADVSVTRTGLQALSVHKHHLFSLYDHLDPIAQSSAMARRATQRMHTTTNRDLRMRYILEELVLYKHLMEIREEVALYLACMIDVPAFNEID